MDVALGYSAAAAASIAAAIDIRSRRIPNWLTLSILAIGLLVNLWRGGATGGLLALLGALLGLGMLLPFYAIRAIGAGDVKLLAALGAVVGPQVLVSVAVYGAIAGGVISTIMLARSGRLLQVLHEIFVEHRPPSRGGQTAPYGVAIATGTYLTLFLPGVIG